jgi:hypothetical protein
VLEGGDMTVLMRRLQGLRIDDRRAAAGAVVDLATAADGGARLQFIAGTALSRAARLPDPIDPEHAVGLLARQPTAIDVVVHAVPHSVSALAGLTADDHERGMLENLVLLASQRALEHVLLAEPLVRWGPFGLKAAEDFAVLQILHRTTPGLEFREGLPAPDLHVHNVLVAALLGGHLLPIDRHGLLRVRTRLLAIALDELASLVQERGFEVVRLAVPADRINWRLAGVPTGLPKGIRRRTEHGPPVRAVSEPILGERTRDQPVELPDVTYAVISPQGHLRFASVSSRAVLRHEDNIQVLYHNGPWDAAHDEIGGPCRSVDRSRIGSGLMAWVSDESLLRPADYPANEVGARTLNALRDFAQPGAEAIPWAGPIVITATEDLTEGPLCGAIPPLDDEQRALIVEAHKAAIGDSSSMLFVDDAFE